MGVDSVTRVQADDLLDETTVVDYLIGRGVVGQGDPVRVVRLSGGVSNVVLRVDSPEQGIVVKQALGRLNVADVWFADRGRAQHEAEALRILRTISPEAVPSLLDDDPRQFAISISAAPCDWANWKTRLMSGSVDHLVAARLGDLLGTWHSTTASLHLGDSLESLETFHQLRVHPYFEISAARAPNLAPRLLDVATQVTNRRECLVLGDFSPKNVLVCPSDAGSVWVIDHEVAHRGDPTFDVAFMTCHLVLKALHLTENRERVAECLYAFLEAYGDGPGVQDIDHTASVVGALMVARVIGSSPVEYLRDVEKRATMDVAAQLLDRGISVTGKHFTEEIPWLTA